MREIIASGKTRDEAVENGYSQLSQNNATIGDVLDVITLEEGSKGLFGLFGSRPYKVKLVLREEAEDDPLADLFAKPEPKAEKQPTPRAERPARAPEKKSEPKPAPVEKKPEPAAEAPVTEAAPIEAVPAAEAAETVPAAPKPVQRKPKQPRTDKPENRAEKKAEEGENADKPARQPRPRKERSPRPEGEKAQKKAEQPKREPKPKADIRPLEKPVVTMIPDDQVEEGSHAATAQAFLRELTHLMGVDVEVAVGTDEEKNVFVQMTGDTLGILIGRRGETLDALQYLTSLRVNRGQEDYTRVTLDTENYRAKREDTLVRLANRMANRAIKTNRKVSLEPMNPYERRIIHSALQQIEEVDTHSEGEEPNRHVVITLRK